MLGGVSRVMALSMTLLAGFLMLSGVQASNIADGSMNHGFLSKYLLSRSQSSKSSFGVNSKFMVHRLNQMEHGGLSEASSDHYGLADDASVTVGSSHPDGNFDGGEVIAMPISDSSFMTYSNNKLIELFAIGVALFSCVAMVRIRMRRRMQPAIVLASSGQHGIDMSIPMATISSDNTVYPKSQCPAERIQCSERAIANLMRTDISSPCALWDPLILGEGAPEAHVKTVRESELQHGRVAVAAVFVVSTTAVNAKVRDVPPHPTVGARVRMPRPSQHTRLRARPDDCPEEVWERIVEAEQASREKKGQIGAALWSLDKGSIEQNQLRIWEELKERQASGAKPPKRKPETAEAKPSNNPFAGVMKAFKDVYDEADAMGYAQAVALNKQLEDKGVLSKAKRNVTPSDDDDIALPQSRVDWGEVPRKSVKRKKGKGAKPKSKKGAGFS